MIYKRIEYETKMNDGEPVNWWYIMPKILLVYNNFKIHSVIEMTPQQARKPENIDKVRQNLEKHRVNNREYPEIIINNKVRKLIKKR